MKPVGVLGGMGPQATVLLMQKVIAAVPVRDDHDHIPLIVHQNPQVPSRINAILKGQGPDPMPILMNMAQDLERAGAQALAMPSVSAHHYALAVAHATSLPFLDMVELAARDLAIKGHQNIGMLAPPDLQHAQIFDTAFDDHGLAQVWSKHEAGPVFDPSGTSQTSGARLQRQASALMKDGADHLLVANTAFSSLANMLPAELPMTDCLDCLAQAVVAFART